MTTEHRREITTGGRYPLALTELGNGAATLERYFDAPRELVFELLTDPQLVPEWWGPRRLRTRVVEMDVRVGGRWAFENVDDDGNVYAFQGEYLELEPPSAITQTFEFLGAPGMVSTERLTLSDHGAGTLLRVVADYGSEEAAQAAMGSGMEQGAGETYDRLEELLLARAV